jgi:hypothetical protein
MICGIDRTHKEEICTEFGSKILRKKLWEQGYKFEDNIKRNSKGLD